MPLFRYIALNIQGKKQKGIVDALSMQEAKDKLRAQSVIVLKLHPFNESKLCQFKHKKLKGSSLINFTTQLCELCKARIPLYEALLSLEEMYRGEPLHYIPLTLSEDIKRGVSLSTSLTQFSSSFSPLYIALIKAGEAIGAVDKALEKIAALLTKEVQLKKKLTTTLMYPAFLLTFSLFVIGTLLIFVVPSLEVLFEERNVNGFTKAIFSLSHFIRTKWIFFLPGLTLLVGAMGVLVKKKRKEVIQFLLGLPFIKVFVIEGTVARFSRTLSTLLEGGIGLKEGLSISRQVIGFEPLAKVMENAEKKIIEGSFLSIELKKSLLIPPLVSRMIAIGEEGGSLSLMLKKVADFYDDEVEKKSSRLLSLAGPMILLLMGVIVGLIMMSVLLPLTDTKLILGG